MIFLKIPMLFVMLALELVTSALSLIVAVPRIIWSKSDETIKELGELEKWSLDWEIKNPFTDDSTNQNRFNFFVALMLVFITSFLITSKVYSSDYSEGYRMGRLNKFSLKGNFVKSGEGELSMGREGSFYEKCSGSGKERNCKRINPWKFSTEPTGVSKVNPFSGKYVVIQYRQVRLNNPLKYSTDYRVKDIYPVNKSIRLGKGYVGSVPGGTKSEGFRTGRVVKASSKGHISKTYEIIIQIGNSGNQYKHMSTKDPKLFEFAIKTLKSAKQVKLLYTERGLLQFSMDDTKYQLYGIEPLEDI